MSAERLPWIHPNPDPLGPLRYSQIDPSRAGNVYRYAVPEACHENHGWDWTHRDETDVREELWTIARGDTVIDIGSACGSFTLWALAHGAAFGYAINPCHGENELFAASLRANGWEDRCDIMTAGVHSWPAYLVDGKPDGNPNGRGFRQNDDLSYSFEATTLDELFRKKTRREGRVAMKIDIEGGELHFAEGAEQTFRKWRPAFVLIELHHFRGVTSDALSEHMALLDYRLERERPYHETVSHSVYVPR